MSTQASRSRARFKHVEKEVAKFLTSKYQTIGKCPIFRIPILGREGPDITINEVGLVIDVKSRLVIPDYMFAPANTFLYFGGFIGFRLQDILQLDLFPEFSHAEKMSKVVIKWWEHMNIWTQKFYPGLISTIIVHHSRMPIGRSTVIIKSEDRSKLCQMLRSN